MDTTADSHVSTTGDERTAERAFVLGLDGVPWSLIERWSDEGQLPNFARMRTEGAAGTLTSTRPPTTPLAWPSIATGVWPDKHGIYGFQNLSDTYSHQMYTSRDVRVPELWDVLTPSMVGNVPMTYPPDEHDGTLVSGMITPSTNATFTYPPAFGETVLEAIPEYQIGLDYPEYADDTDALQRDIDAVLAARRSLMRMLMDEEDWRLFFFVYTAPDRLQHLVWDEAALLAHYEQLDAILGEVMEYTDRMGADLYVVSDHGFGPIHQLVYTNHLLEREGYLTRRESEGTRGALSTLGISRDGVTRLLNAVGISERTIASRLPKTLVDSVAERIPGDHALYDVDYERTTAFVHDAGNVYVNDTRRFEKGIVDPADVPYVKRDLVELFEAVVDDEGEPVLDVFDGDDLFPSDDRSPDLVVNGRGTYETRTSITDELFGDTGYTVASHRPEGIVLCRGPSIRAGASIEDASVVDVAPTLLHGLGEPIPDHVDGHVLDAFVEGSRPETTMPERRAYAGGAESEAVEDDFSDVEDRLKGLGYME